MNLIVQFLEYYGKALSCFGEAIVCVLESVTKLFHKDSC